MALKTSPIGQEARDPREMQKATDSAASPELEFNTGRDRLDPA